MIPHKDYHIQHWNILLYSYHCAESQRMWSWKNLGLVRARKDATAGKNVPSPSARCLVAPRRLVAPSLL